VKIVQGWVVKGDSLFHIKSTEECKGLKFSEIVGNSRLGLSASLHRDCNALT
jgi:hypothetical protein